MEQDGLAVAELVHCAAGGDQRAWECLVRQYVSLIYSVTWEFRLQQSDAADVVQATWLRLLEHIGRLEKPGRVSSWLAMTAKRECLHLVAARGRVHPGGLELPGSECLAVPGEIDDGLLAQERVQVVGDALACLLPEQQRLLDLLLADPPVPYADISARLGIPVGSIGPTRMRCLAKLARDRRLLAYGELRGS